MLQPALFLLPPLFCVAMFSSFLSDDEEKRGEMGLLLLLLRLVPSFRSLVER